VITEHRVGTREEWNRERGALLYITPFGRQEEWQDAPAGVPQDPTGSWTRRSDEYTHEELAGGRS
jgi:hypothetical protein